jgi:deoxyribonuclease IV
MNNKEKQFLGAHFSIAGGLENAIYSAESISCNAIQIFLHSNRQWKIKDLSEEQVNIFKAVLKKSKVDICAVHASYLINLGSKEKEICNKSIQLLTKEIEQCIKLEIPYLVMHPGSHTNSTIEESIKQIAENLSNIFKIFEKLSKNNFTLLLENTAGQGYAIGYKFEQLAEIKNLVDKKYQNKVGFCFDTCHGFVAGYDFANAKSYKSFWGIFDKFLGLENLKLIHLNDSKRELGSKIDRHASIGKGKLGLETFKLLLNDPQLIKIPKILETPYEENAIKAYSKDLQIIKSLINIK